MFLGHFAVAFAAKPLVPRASLALLIIAAQLADVLWPIFVALGLEEVRISPGNTAFTPLEFVSYPYSHSLLMLAVWAVLLGIISRQLIPHRAAVPVVAGLVVSHWVLDWVTHRPDMPLLLSGPRFGLGLWNSIRATLVVELIMFAAGVWIYARATRAMTASARWGFVALIVFLLVVYLANVFAGAPPSVAAVYIAALVGSLLIAAWAWWIDRSRVSAG